MKAIIWTKYGPANGLSVQEVKKPIPKDDEVLIKIHSANVSAGDCEMRQLKSPPLLWFPLRIYIGLLKPKRITILGQEFAGEIDTVGKDVPRFKPGDKVFGATSFSMGAYAQYLCLPAKSSDSVLAMMPANMSYEEAATIPVGGLNAWHFLKQANLQSSQKVVINGSGGSIGTVAAQIAKSKGAKVTCVDSSDKLDMLREIGADRVIDYKRVDFTHIGETYDVIFDVVGKAPLGASLRALNDKGIYITANPTLFKNIYGAITSGKNDKKVIGGTATYSVQNLDHIKKMIEDGKIKAVIDKQFSMEQIAEAHDYVESGKKKGNVIINLH